MAAIFTILTLHVPFIYTVFSKHICKLFHFSSIISNGQCNSYDILMILGKIINYTYNTSNTCVNGYFTKNEADMTSVPYHIHVHNVMYYICNIDRKCS